MKKLVDYLVERDVEIRRCSICGKPMSSGYVDFSYTGLGHLNEAYYCSDACLHVKYDDGVWERLCEEYPDDNYWTDWEEFGAFQYGDESLRDAVKALKGLDVLTVRVENGNAVFEWLGKISEKFPIDAPLYHTWRTYQAYPMFRPQFSDFLYDMRVLGSGYANVEQWESKHDGRTGSVYEQKNITFRESFLLDYNLEFGNVCRFDELSTEMRAGIYFVQPKV